LGEALDQYLRRHGFTRRLQQATVVPEWPDLVGAKIAEVTTPREVRRDGTLVVSVKSAAWMQELQLMEPQIRHQLAQHGKKIKRILWKAE
jgi:predicted nucleic acid-binding Zn ribbon protein